MKKILTLLILILAAILMSSIAYAAVGVGISPSKMVLQVEGGKTQQMEILVYDTGDYPMNLNIGVEGDLAEITQIEPTAVYVDPEPKPIVMPIKNGKKVTITFIPPATRTPRIYTGKVTAAGGVASGQFGGSVGVATLVELRVTKTPSIFAFITSTHILVAGIILGVIIIILLLWRLGLKIEFRRR